MKKFAGSSAKMNGLAVHDLDHLMTELFLCRVLADRSALSMFSLADLVFLFSCTDSMYDSSLARNWEIRLVFTFSLGCPSPKYTFVTFSRRIEEKGTRARVKGSNGFCTHKTSCCSHAFLHCSSNAVSYP